MSLEQKQAAVHPAGATEGPLELRNRLALRIPEAAEALGISESSLRQLLPEIPKIYVGRAVLIPIEPLQRWLRERSLRDDDLNDDAVDDLVAGLQ